MCMCVLASLYVCIYVNMCMYPVSIHSYTARVEIRIQRGDYGRMQMDDFPNTKMTPDRVLTTLWSITGRWRNQRRQSGALLRCSLSAGRGMAVVPLLLKWEKWAWQWLVPLCSLSGERRHGSDCCSVAAWVAKEDVVQQLCCEIPESSSLHAAW